MQEIKTNAYNPPYFQKQMPEIKLKTQSNLYNKNGLFVIMATIREEAVKLETNEI